MASLLSRFRKIPFRLLPLTIFAAALMLTVKVKDIWHGFRILSDISITHTEAAGAESTPKGGTVEGSAAAETKGSKNPERKKPLPAMGGPVVPADTVVPAPAPADESAAGGGNESANPFTQAEVDLLQKLADRRKALDEQAKDLDMRENLLKAAEQRIDTKVTELKQLQAAIEALVKKRDDQQEGQLRSLVKIYENMKPKDAARIFEQLDMPILLDVIERMKEAKVAPILAQMDATKAKTVTAELAQRRQMPLPGG